jgi:hypothetical protein
MALLLYSLPVPRPWFARIWAARRFAFRIAAAHLSEFVVLRIFPGLPGPLDCPLLWAFAGCPLACAFAACASSPRADPRRPVAARSASAAPWILFLMTLSSLLDFREPQPEVRFQCWVLTRMYPQS